MGALSSKDTRRISFDNKFAIQPAIAVHKSIENKNIMELQDLAEESADELIFKDNSYNSLTSESLDTNNSDYWARRIENLKKEHQVINKIIESEYEKTVESTNKVYETPRVVQEKVQKIKPCFEWRAKILQCYEDNPHQPLMCSAVVHAFSQCIKSCRMEE